MAFEKMPVIPGDIITSAWGNHIQTQYDEAKADLAAHTAQSAVDTHGSTVGALPNRLIHRDAAGRAKVAAPSASDDIARLDTVTAHTARSAAGIHGSTVTATPNSLIHRDANGRAQVANGTAPNDICTFDQLTSHQAATASINAIGHVYAAEFTATLSTSWSGSAAPYTQTVTINGITSAHNPIIDVVMSGTYSTDQQRSEQWGYIYRAVTGSNQITFYALEKPTVSLPIRVKVVA